MTGRGRRLVPNLEKHIACLEDLDRFHPVIRFRWKQISSQQTNETRRNGCVFVQT